MARIHGPIPDQSAVRRMTQERRDHELAALFGQPLIVAARAIDPADIVITAESMDAVHDAADELLAQAGDAAAQRRIVEGLEAGTQLLLCMWVMDLSLGPILAERAARQPFQVCR